MDLREWLSKEKMSIQAFADEVRIDRTYISKVLTGRVHPSLAVALDIRAATRGEVPLEQLLPLAIRPPSTGPVKPSTSRKTADPSTSRSRAFS